MFLESNIIIRLAATATIPPRIDTDATIDVILLQLATSAILLNLTTTAAEPRDSIHA